MKQKLLISLLFVLGVFDISYSQNYLVADFESGYSGTPKIIWGAGSCDIVDNSFQSGINTSAKSLAVTNNAWVPVTIPCTLPAGKTWNDYKSVKVNFCLTAGTDLSWAQVQIGLCAGDWGMENIGTLSNIWGDGVLGTWYSVEVPIDETKLANYLVSNNPSYLIVKYDKPAGNNFLLDDVELVSAQLTGLNTRMLEVFSLSQIGKNIYKLKSDADDQIESYSIYNTSGNLIRHLKANCGEIEIDLNAQNQGIYLLKVQTANQSNTYKLLKR